MKPEENKFELPNSIAKQAISNRKVWPMEDYLSLEFAVVVDGKQNLISYWSIEPYVSISQIQIFQNKILVCPYSNKKFSII